MAALVDRVSSTRSAIEAREDSYYELHKESIETGVGLAIDGAVVEAAAAADVRGNGPDPMLFVAKQILVSHGIDTQGVEQKIASQRQSLPNAEVIDEARAAADLDVLGAVRQAQAPRYHVPLGVPRRERVSVPSAHLPPAGGRRDGGTEGATHAQRDGQEDHADQRDPSHISEHRREGRTRGKP